MSHDAIIGELSNETGSMGEKIYETMMFAWLLQHLCCINVCNISMFVIAADSSSRIQEQNLIAEVNQAIGSRSWQIDVQFRPTF
jgi:hypothetical protein